MQSEVAREVEIRRSSVLLWSGILAGPFAWATAFELQYSLVAWVCANRALWLFWVTDAAALLVCAAGAWLAWSARRFDDSPRARFMSASGLLLCFIFAIAIVAVALPPLILHPCE